MSISAFTQAQSLFCEADFITDNNLAYIKPAVIRGNHTMYVVKTLYMTRSTGIPTYLSRLIDDYLPARSNSTQPVLRVWVDGYGQHP